MYISLGFYNQITKKIYLDNYIIYLIFFTFSFIYAFYMLLLYQDYLNIFFKSIEQISLIFSFIILILSFSYLSLIYKKSKYNDFEFWMIIKLIIVNLILIYILNKFPLIIFYISSFISVQVKNFLLSPYFIIILKILLSIFLSSLLVSFSVLIIYLLKDTHSIKNNFISSQKNLEKLLEKFDNNNEQCNSKGLYTKKEFINIFYIFDYYKDGIENIKQLISEDIQFNNIVHTSSGKSINETFDNLIFSIPFFLFYGDLEQLKEMQIHLININSYIDDVCCIAGNQFLNEIFKMNYKIESFLEQNSFKLSRTNVNFNKNKYDYYEKRIILLILSLISSIIISKMV